MDKDLKRSLALLNQENPSFFNRLYNFGRAKTFVDLNVIEREMPKGQKAIIDVGCGSGMVSLFLHFKDKARTVFGFDLNEYRIKNLKRLVKANDLKKLNFAVKDLVKDKDIPPAEAYLMMDLLHHVDKKTQYDLLKAIYGRMTDSSILIIKDISRDIGIKLFITWILDMIISKGDRVHYRSINEWKTLLRKLGFSMYKAYRVKSFLYPHLLIVCRKK